MNTAETVDFRLILIDPVTRRILVRESIGDYRLPRTRLSQRVRLVQQLRREVKNRWELDAFILDIRICGSSNTNYAIAEIATLERTSALHLVRINQIPEGELSEAERIGITDVLDDRVQFPFARLGSIDQIITWITSVTGESFSSKEEIEQLNAGDGFALFKFRSDVGDNYWFKATGIPNLHELAVTSLLSKIGGPYLPGLISTRPDWNAWLSRGEGDDIPELPREQSARARLLENMVTSMADLQIRTVSWKSDLLAAGAHDQDLNVLASRSEEVFDYIEEAMSRQVSTKVAPLEKSRIHQLREIFRNICLRVIALDFPTSVLHGDLNLPNILAMPDHCQFIDWSEAYIGNPLITLEHLLLLNQVDDPARRIQINQRLKCKYCSILAKICAPQAIDRGVVYMPFLAAFSTLYGRGDWLVTPQRDDPNRQSYARTLARHMDRAASAPDLRESLKTFLAF